jgi:hypothetical protein
MVAARASWRGLDCRACSVEEPQDAHQEQADLPILHAIALAIERDVAISPYRLGCGGVATTAASARVGARPA